MTPYQTVVENTMDKNFQLDKKTIIAIVLIGIVVFGWQNYLSKKYPQVSRTPVANQASNQSSQNEQLTTKGSEAQTNNSVKIEPPSADIKKTVATKDFHYEDGFIKFSITSEGMGLKNVTLKSYSDSKKNPIVLSNVPNEDLFQIITLSNSQKIFFDMKEEKPGAYVGTAQIANTVIKRELFYNSEKKAFFNKIYFNNISEEILKGIALIIPEKIIDTGSGSFLFPNYSVQEFFVNHEGKTENINFGSTKENIQSSFKTAKLASISSQYFTAAILDKSELFPDVELKSNIESKNAILGLVYKPINLSQNISLDQIFYVGPKSIDILEDVDAQLVQLINFGSLEVISKPMLAIMKWFYTIVGNWGIAIILLTLAVRVAVLPFNIYSTKSMKAMQKIQPMINGLRERYKNDPMTLNKEMMALMKEHKANPMSGCLPMLLQIPIFFALYKVIGSSIELYHSPFFGWITDLSSADKYFVLPILMGITMYIQQKITPTTMDPAQAKILAFLPLIFTFFMLQLPSGLTLYMFVSALFGIIQQYILMKDNTVVPITKK